METKTARLTVLLDPAKKKALEQFCLQQDVTPSQVIRQLIRDYLKHHGVEWVPSGLDGTSEPSPADDRAAPATHPIAGRSKR